MAKAPRLKNAVRDLIDELRRKSDKLHRQKKYQDSVGLLLEAVALIPSPETEYTEYQRLWFSIAERYSLMQDFENEFAAYQKVALSAGVVELPMYHISRGKCLRALGRIEDALNELCKGKQLLQPTDWKQFFKEVGEAENIGLVEQFEGTQFGGKQGRDNDSIPDQQL